MIFILLIMFFLISCYLLFIKSDVDLRNTRWKCNVSHLYMSSDAYQSYDMLNESMVYNFTSKDDFFIDSHAETVSSDDNPIINKYEVTYTGKYSIDKDIITMQYLDVLVRKKHVHEHINKTQELYKGISISYYLSRENSTLYLSGTENNESGELYNHVCYLIS